MKTIKILFVTVAMAIGFSSCTREVYVEDLEPQITLNELMHSYEIWYIDVNESNTNGEIPFMQIAFTISFRNGVLYANNNLSGIGINGTGNGYGIDVGYYDVYPESITLDHDLDGAYNFSVQQLAYNKIRLYNYATNTSFVLYGYQRANFNYDYVFYDNIHYFLQEFEAWEKIYTSVQGEVNEFDNENYLAFLPDGNGDTFLSSVDGPGLNPGQVYWDYEGIFEVLDFTDDDYVKGLTLDYDFMDNEYFELYVINDETIELYHPYSGTTYRFAGRGYIQYMKTGTTSGKEKLNDNRKLRIKENNKTFNKNAFKIPEQKI